MDQKVGSVYRSHHAQAYASTRGSAPALSTPVFVSMTIPPFEPSDHGGDTRSLWPLPINASRVASGIRDSTAMSPGYIVCGNGEAGKPREDQRGASMACWMFMPKSTMLIRVCIVRMT